MIPSSFDAADFRHVCAKYATGITITTVCGDDGSPHGMTVNSFSSVSLAPPLILVCIDLRAALMPLFRTGKHFGVNVLSEAQKDLSNRFAQKGEDRFEGVAWVTGASGVPLIRGALASFECAVTKIIEAGDHIVAIGEVLHIERAEGRPLIYFDSKYRTLG